MAPGNDKPVPFYPTSIASPMMPKLFAGLGVMAITVLSLGSMADADIFTHCRDVVIRNSDGSIYTRTYNLSQKNTGCGLARRLAHRYLVDDGARLHGPLGFQCAGNANGVSCHEGNRRVTWDYHFPSAEALGRGRVTGDLVLKPRGIGPIQFGMTLGEASDALGARVDADPSIHGCSSWSVPSAPDGVSLTAFQGRLRYALLYERGPRTSKGIQVGDHVSRLRHLYRGELHRGRSASLSGADFHLFTDERHRGATFTIDFEIADKRVAFIAAGTRHVIETFGECA